MNYPVPKKTELFFQYSDTEHTNANKLLKDIKEDKAEDWFSRDKRSEYMDEYLKEVKRLKSSINRVLIGNLSRLPQFGSKNG